MGKLTIKGPQKAISHGYVSLPEGTHMEDLCWKTLKGFGFGVARKASDQLPTSCLRSRAALFDTPF